jgi:hypothetical protein
VNEPLNGNKTMKFDILLKIYEENRRRGINGNNAT